MTTQTKGRPTPKAPQNRPKAPAPPAELTPLQEAALAALKARRAARRRTAPMRRAFRGIVSRPEVRHLHPQLARMLSTANVENGQAHRQGVTA